jgi:junction plakoglobin
MEVMNLIEQPIKVTEWQQTYTYDSGIHSGANTCVPSVSSKGVMEEDDTCGRQYTLKKTTTYTQGVPQSQGQDPLDFSMRQKTQLCPVGGIANRQILGGGPWFEGRGSDASLRDPHGLRQEV